jgi:SAM-dependent methyltransferase
VSEPDEARIRAEIITKYRAVAEQPAGQFAYPVGRESALGLGYEHEWVESIPPEVVERVVGVGNPFAHRRPSEGQSVLDLGCGCGFDSFVASTLVGAHGRVVGVDISPEMLAVARRGLASWPLQNLRFMEASVDNLPFGDEEFDLAISNGVLNLVPDKDAAFREIHRVLRPGGHLAIADLMADETIPEDVFAAKDAWSA